MDAAANPPPGPNRIAGRPDWQNLFTPRLAALAARGVSRVYKPGSIVIHEGAPGGSMFFVGSGLVRTFTAREEDGAEFTFGFYGPRETLGEMSLDGSARSASVVAVQTTVCKFVDRDLLKTSIAQDPELAFELMGLLTRRARMLSDRARDLALYDVYGLMKLFLRREAQLQADGSLRVPYTLTQVQLAQQLGCARTMVTKLLKALIEGGYLRLDSTDQGKLWTVVKPLPKGF